MGSWLARNRIMNYCLNDKFLWYNGNVNNGGNMQPGANAGVDNTNNVNSASSAGLGSVPNSGAAVGTTQNLMTQGQPKKKGNAMLLGMIVFALLAAGGIGFGVWAMLDGNSQIAKKDEQISALKKQNNELQDKITELEEVNTDIQSEDEEAQEQAEEAEEQVTVEETLEEATVDENGYQVLSIGECLFDGGSGKTYILKCDGKTSLGDGKFVWNSEDNKLFFAVSPKS